MAAHLAGELGLPSADAFEIGRAGGLHDIGMALVPSELLNRPGRLDCREKELMRCHGAWAGEILTLTGDPRLRLAAQVAREHHERWDGSGYPRHLKGTEICLPARIVAICAVYDALLHPRPGKGELSHEMALSVLHDGDTLSGPEAFDPAVRDAFFRRHHDFRRIAEASS